MSKIYFYRIVPTPLGSFAFVFQDKIIHRSYLPERDEGTMLDQILDAFPNARQASDAWSGSIADLLVAYAEGEVVDFSKISLAWDNAPPFRRQVWKVVRALGRGKVSSYGEIAAKAGSPLAARAVGQSMAKNKFAPFVPCHRVLAAGNKPGGFSAYRTTDMKAQMLALEGYQL